MKQQIFVFAIILSNYYLIYSNGWNLKISKNGLSPDLKKNHDIDNFRSVSNLQTIPRKIFFCTNNDGNGRREIKKILSSVFNEYTIEFMMEKRIPSHFYSLNYTHNNNIFVDTYSFQSCTREWIKWLLLYFDGKFLFSHLNLQKPFLTTVIHQFETKSTIWDQ